MSDLSASHCGCSGNSPQTENNGCCNSIIWIIILFFLCGNGNGILGGNNGCGCGGNGILGGNNGCGCEALIVLILLFSCCGNNNY